MPQDMLWLPEQLLITGENPIADSARLWMRRSVSELSGRLLAALPNGYQPPADFNTLIALLEPRRDPKTGRIILKHDSITHPLLIGCLTNIFRKQYPSRTIDEKIALMLAAFDPVMCYFPEQLLPSKYDFSFSTWSILFDPDNFRTIIKIDNPVIFKCGDMEACEEKMPGSIQVVYQLNFAEQRYYCSGIAVSDSAWASMMLGEIPTKKQWRLARQLENERRIIKTQTPEFQRLSDDTIYLQQAVFNAEAGYSFCFISDDIPDDPAPEIGKLYLSKTRDGYIAYTVITPTGETVRRIPTNIPAPTSFPWEFTRDELKIIRSQILAITSAAGHTYTLSADDPYTKNFYRAIHNLLDEVDLERQRLSAVDCKLSPAEIAQKRNELMQTVTLTHNVLMCPTGFGNAAPNYHFRQHVNAMQCGKRNGLKIAAGIALIALNVLILTAMIAAILILTKAIVVPATVFAVLAAAGLTKVSVGTVITAVAAVSLKITGLRFAIGLINQGMQQGPKQAARDVEKALHELQVEDEQQSAVRFRTPALSQAR